LPVAVIGDGDECLDAAHYTEGTLTIMVKWLVFWVLYTASSIVFNGWAGWMLNRARNICTVGLASIVAEVHYMYWRILIFQTH
jgi:hypothetical protein